MGKTRAGGLKFKARQKHPHGRGEDLLCHYKTEYRKETPPRAWGRPCDVRYALHTLRNTPTGVGKTDQYKIRFSFMQKHPHGRGEDPLPGNRA